MNNLQEFLTGTDPLNVQLRVPHHRNQHRRPDVQVSWTAVTGKTNQLQRAPIPDGTATWLNVGSVAIGNGSIVTQPISELAPILHTSSIACG